jgi:hypothetical protein
MTATLAECLRAHELVLSIDARHVTGCCWHIFLDDTNIEDHSVEFCIGNSKHEDCRALGPLVRLMSKTQRLKLRSGGYRVAYERAMDSVTDGDDE